MDGQKDTDKLKIPLSPLEQLLLMRYIEAERVEPNFISKGLEDQFTQDILLYSFFACHGCSDHSQIILLNEKSVDKIFWRAEENIKHLLG